MTLATQIAELLRKPWLRPGEVMVVLGVTEKKLRAIRRARPDMAVRYPGYTHHRYKTAIVVELMGGSANDAETRRRGDAPTLP